MSFLLSFNRADLVAFLGQPQPRTRKTMSTIGSGTPMSHRSSGSPTRPDLVFSSATCERFSLSMVSRLSSPDLRRRQLLYQPHSTVSPTPATIGRLLAHTTASVPTRCGAHLRCLGHGIGRAILCRADMKCVLLGKLLCGVASWVLQPHRYRCVRCGDEQP